MNFRYFSLQPFSAAMNMALDEVFMEEVKQGKEPVLRLYQWKPSAVSIGYFQGIKYEVDQQACKENGVDIVRRQTGGGAVFHEQEITYSIIAPQGTFSTYILKSYEKICGYLVAALKSLGVEAKFSPINDIVVADRKISGNAQTRKNGILLQHGTIICKVDVEKMFSLLKVGKEKRSDKLIQSVKKAVT
ncbi:MAG: lipoate--protein ligase family protein, partial [Nanoarchaeota archaeon]|nr:lipoate--protein ligase family protein [Nanoarchaeota archaeon]